jgi:hypothetical protein
VHAELQRNKINQQNSFARTDCSPCRAPISNVNGSVSLGSESALTLAMNVANLVQTSVERVCRPDFAVSTGYFMSDKLNSLLAEFITWHKDYCPSG